MGLRFAGYRDKHLQELSDPCGTASLSRFVDRNRGLVLVGVGGFLIC